jgi:hypothetical protein
MDALKADREGFAAFCANLFSFASDERNLMCAADHLQRYGGSAAGPDGEQLADLCPMGKSWYARSLRDRLRKGEYSRGPLKRC